MPDFNVRSDSVNVEQIMEQIRARIREKRGVDYTEEQIRELAAVKLQKFLDPRGVRSNLIEEFRRTQPPYEPPDLPNYAFEENTLFDSHRAVLRGIRRLLQPLLKLFFNPNPLIQALNIQARLNRLMAEREAQREASRRSTDSLYFELIHNLVVETTRLGIEVKNQAMRVESLVSRLEFTERRARALESVVVYKPSNEDIAAGAERAGSAQMADTAGMGTGDRGSHEASAVGGGTSSRPPTAIQPTPQGDRVIQADRSTQGEGLGPGQRSRRRRRRRGRRGRGPAAAVMGGGAPSAAPPPGGTPSSGPPSGGSSSAGSTTPGQATESQSADATPETHSATAETLERALGSPAHSSEGNEQSKAGQTDFGPPDDSK